MEAENIPSLQPLERDRGKSLSETVKVAITSATLSKTLKVTCNKYWPISIFTPLCKQGYLKFLFK